MSHIPIISFCPFFDVKNEGDDLNWHFPRRWMHIDARRIKDLLKKHPNVRTYISGHIHLTDKVEYLGVNYYCNGSVAGQWWRGAYQEFNPTYTLVDFYEDGSSESTMVEHS